MKRKNSTSATAKPAGDGLRRPHWSVRPGSLLLVFLAFGFFRGFLSHLADSLGGGVIRTHIFAPEGLGMISGMVLVLFAAQVLSLLIGIGVFFGIRHFQRENGIGFTHRMAGGSLWVGAALLLGYAALLFALCVLPTQSDLSLQQSVAYPVAVLGAVSALVVQLLSCLLAVLMASQLFPAFVRRFGPVRGALAIGASFAALAVADSLLADIIRCIITPSSQAVLFSWNGNLSGLFGVAANALAAQTLVLAVFFLFRQRILGSWLACAALLGAFALLPDALRAVVPLDIFFSDWFGLLFSQTSLSIMLFALSLAVLWKFKRKVKT